MNRLNVDLNLNLNARLKQAIKNVECFFLIEVNVNRFFLLSFFIDPPVLNMIFKKAMYVTVHKNRHIPELLKYFLFCEREQAKFCFIS